MLPLATRIDAIPVVNSTADRDAKYPVPSIYQRVQNLGTGDIEQWDGAAWNVLIPGGVAQRLRHGTGSPEGVVTADPSTLYQQEDGSDGVAVWVKDSGTGNTGWRQLQSGPQSPATVFADAFAGATADLKIQAALNALTSAGGVVDARGIIGAQTITNPFTLNKPCTLLLGDVQFTANNGFCTVTAEAVKVVGLGRNLTRISGTRDWSLGDVKGFYFKGVDGGVITGVDYTFEMTGTTAAITTCFGILMGGNNGTSSTVGCTNFLVADNDVKVFGTEPGASQRYLGIMAWSETTTFPALVKDGRITGNRLHAIPGRSIEPALTENVVIDGNVISDAGSGATVVAVGIRTIGNKNLTVVGNSVHVLGTAINNSDCIQVDGDNVSTGVTITGNSCRTSALNGTGIKIGGNASNVTVAGNTILYDGTAVTNMFGVLVTFNPPSSTLNGAGMPTQNATMVAVHDNLVAGFVTQLGVKRADAGDPYPTHVSFTNNHLGPMWDGSSALGNFMDFPTAEVLSGDILVHGNWVPTGVSGMVEQFLGVVSAPGVQGGLTNPALSGEFRTPSTGQFKFRNNANSADIIGLSKTASDIVQVGASGAVESQVSAGGAVIGRARAAGWSPGATSTLDLGESALLWRDLNLSRKGNMPRAFGTGTAHVAGDYALAAGWGNTATVSAVAARDWPGGRVSITCNGTGIVANPTITLTWKDGTWTTVPAVVCSRGDLVMPVGGFNVTTPGATTCVFTFNGLPVAGNVYILDYVTGGK